MQQRDEDVGATAAEQAFDALRAEVAGMRQIMQALPEAIKKSRPVDTTETLGAIATKLEAMAGFMAKIEQHPAIRLTPTAHQQAIADAGNVLMNEAVRALNSAKASAIEERRELAAMIGTMRGKWQLWEWADWSGLAALVLGVLISPFFARLLPLGWDGQVAAFIMNGDRWNAGSALMQAQNSEAWRGLMNDFNLVKNNQAALEACHEAAATAKKEQRCSIIVPSRKPSTKSSAYSWASSPDDLRCFVLHERAESIQKDWFAIEAAGIKAPQAALDIYLKNGNSGTQQVFYTYTL